MAGGSATELNQGILTTSWFAVNVDGKWKCHKLETRNTE